MVPVAIIFSAALVGVSVAMTLVALIMRGSDDRRRLSTSFVVLSVTMALFALNQIARNSCHDLAVADVVARLAGTLTCAVANASLLVYGRLLQPARGRWLDRSAIVALSLLMLYSLISPGGILFTHVQEIQTIPAGWWGPITVLRGPADPMAGIGFSLFFIMSLRLVHMTWSARQSVGLAQTAILLVPPITFLMPIVHGYGLIQGWWSGVPLGEYAMATEYAALALALHRRERSLQAEVAHHRRRIDAVMGHGVGLAGLLDPSGRLVLANRTALVSAGIPESEVIGRHFTETPWWRHDEQARRRLQTAIDRAAAGEPDRFVTSHPLPGGGLMDVDFSLTPYRGPDGTIEYLIAEGRDISDLRKMDRLVHESSKMQAVGQLAGGIAHDFNNVLCGIMGAAELALRRTQDPEVRRRIEVILNASANAGEITRRLLTFARKGSVLQAPLRLNAVVEESLELFTRAAGPAIRVERDLLACPDVSLGERGEVQSAILNLCFNARDAMPQGGRLNVTTTRQRLDAPLTDAVGHQIAPGSYIRIEIGDNGSGIAPDVLARIFEPFFTTKPEGKGTGLGLPAVVNTAHAHGGGLLVQTAVGQGSTFALLLGAEEGVTPTAMHAVQAFRANGELVVLVDDDDQVRRQSDDLLSSLGFRVEAFGDPLKARQRLMDPAGVSCVVLDLAMPGLNGRELLRDLRRVDSALPVIICSGDASEPQAVQSADRHLAYLPKPWRLDQLRAVMLRLGVVPMSGASTNVTG